MYTLSNFILVLSYVTNIGIRRAISSGNIEVMFLHNLVPIRMLVFKMKM